MEMGTGTQVKMVSCDDIQMYELWDMNWDVYAAFAFVVDEVDINCDLEGRDCPLFQTNADDPDWQIIKASRVVLIDHTTRSSKDYEMNSNFMT